MTKNKIQTWKFLYVLILISSFLVIVVCQEEDEASGDKFGNSAAATEMFSQYASSRFTNLSSSLKDDIKAKFSFCITDVETDWNAAFNFSKNPKFLSECARSTKGDMMKRVCTAAEVKFYFSSFYQSGGEAKKSSFLKPNKNCNLTSWVSGCEPGWACSAGKQQKINLKNSTEIPYRVQNCSACCEGFFCPRGITCMIPCPLGAYCPLASLNTSTGVCDPYRYQLPPDNPDHTCGGADTWADVMSSSEVFCSGGSYCPSTIQKIPCSKGHYCRTGSTSELLCFRFATCNPKSANQNITAYGLMLFAGLGFLIVIIYNCSDQVIATREKKKELSREKAVQSVRETAQAREKWTSAKEIAKKHAIGLQTSFSRTFSRRKSLKHPASQAKPAAADAAGLPPTVSTGTSQQPQKKEKGNLTKMLHEIEDNPESHEGFNIDIGDKQGKKNPPKGKQLHTQSQMFRYAYGQIEKEKALQEQNKNLTFSGVISMANEVDELIRKRFTIEIVFKDLTITLKGKNIHLMRSVSGKLSPGRVSAVMGPSGAGKTTFLSALTGKAPGCVMTGSVQINGKDESIQAYKKIIGFVPQDDIVHGNLTVAENLWFSARCRLPADLAKPEKVLVVERVIESLGLQAVRDSLVGTVEKRGISGGQRKRVNVGLEMVMEPSLLILDEPTSGLDSSSSQLLLRALRREALEGVNICMVVHQPSYTLYRMFDDLILLAKGGLTVYHGPVKKAEEYFAGLGINLPDRANPPDYFIDILEGITKLNTGTGLTVKQLPVRWMLHNGYSVPMDMLNSIEGMSGKSGESSSHGGSSAHATGSEQNSFAGELWQDVKCSVETKKDRLQHNIFKSADLSERTTPGVFTQYRYYLGRLLKQRLREVRTQVVDYLILLLAGICLGTLAEVSDETFGAMGYTYTVIGVSLLCKIAALRSFGLDKLHYWRERSSGMSSLAYFLAKDTIDHFNTVIKPLVYLSMFYFFNNPRWRREIENENSDSTVRLMRDQIIMAQVYIGIAKMKNKLGLQQELKIRVKESQRAVGESTVDADLPHSAPEKIKAMGKVLSIAREQLYDCKLVTGKLRAMLQISDEQVRSLKKQSTFLSQLAAKTIPNAIHCLSMRLTIEYYLLPLEKRKFPRSENLENPNLYHYALFSDNVLAASVVVNSTIMNAKDPLKHVFHLVTDKLNFGAMNMWFLLNPPGKATINVENVDEFKWLNSSYCPVLRQLETSAMKEYYFKADNPTKSASSNLKYRNPKYLSMLNHLRFYLPQVYPKLDKILFLDDDIVVQNDLTGLWSVDLHGKVNGAVETCGESFHRFDKYLNFSNPHISRNFDPNACGWAYGMNMFDLKEWKKRDITGIYHKWQNMNEDRALWKLGTLPPGLITFYGLTHPLEKSWHVLGLGYNPSVDKKEIEHAAVIHYNGNMKPWLELAMTKYRSYWTKYIKYDHPYLRSCNLSE